MYKVVIDGKWENEKIYIDIVERNEEMSSFVFEIYICYATIWKYITDL